MRRLIRFLFGPSRSELVDGLAHLARMQVELHLLAREVQARMEKVKAELRESEKKRRQLEEELERTKADLSREMRWSLN